MKNNETERASLPESTCSAIYIAHADGRESHDYILGVYAVESDAYSRLGKYIREHNTEEDMSSRWHTKPVCKMTDEELGRVSLNQYFCIIGGVERHEIVLPNMEFNNTSQNFPIDNNNKEETNERN